MSLQEHGSLQPDRGHFSTGESQTQGHRPLTALRHLPLTSLYLSLSLSPIQYKTDLVPILKVPTRTVQPSFVYLVPGESSSPGRTVYLELTPPPEVTYKTSPGSSQQMNVLGIVIFSATMGEHSTLA